MNNTQIEIAKRSLATTTSKTRAKNLMDVINRLEKPVYNIRVKNIDSLENEVSIFLDGREIDGFTVDKVGRFSRLFGAPVTPLIKAARQAAKRALARPNAAALLYGSGKFTVTGSFTL